jgi:excisionase family DNA binding protein
MPKGAGQELITTAEAARRLGISPRAIRKHIERGHLTPYAITTRLTRVDWAEVQALDRQPGRRPKKPKRKADKKTHQGVDHEALPPRADSPL